MTSPARRLPQSAADPSIATLCAEVDDCLRDPARLISSGDVPGGMRLLFEHLDDERAQRSALDWERFRNACRAHPLRSLLQEDPLIRRSCTRPRGYAGDAEVIDFIYRDGNGLPDECTPLGEAVHRGAVAVEPAAAVRRRLDHIVTELDAFVKLRGTIDALSVACGHLREADRSVAIRKGHASVIALDQDPESLALVESENASRGVTTMRADIRHLIAGRAIPGTFDFIWSAGLYDYLDARAAKKLTQRLIAMLRSGGRLLIANFTPQCSCVGFMETFMDWQLVYREEQEVQDMVAELEDVQTRITRDETNAIIWLDVTRA